MIEVFPWLISAYLSCYYILVYLQRRRSPPGPIPTPFLGNMVQVAMAGNTPSLAFDNLAKKYGEVFQLRVGMKTMVVPTSLEAITTIFNLPESYGRDHTGTLYDRNFRKNLGIGFSDGPHWEKTKQWTIRNLRDFGFGKSASMESSIQEKLKALLNEIDKTRAKNNNVVVASGLFNLPIVKMLWQMIVGHCTDEDMKVIADLIEKNEELYKKGTLGAGLIAAFPLLRFLFPGATGHTVQMNFYKEATAVARDLLTKSAKSIAERKKSGLLGVKPENLVEAFVYEAGKNGGNADTIFTDENFIVIFMDLIQAGSDTNRYFLEAFLLFMILYPDVQSKVVDEIQTFGSNKENFTIEDKEKMIYTQATIWEIHRHTKVVQNLLPRRALQDFSYKKYLIKKDTLLVANLHTAYFDENVWDDPMAFRPERFIQNGKLQKLDCLVPFGVGNRMCPGGMLGSATAFLYMTSILKKYKLSRVPGQRFPNQTMHEGFLSRPFPFELVITDRTVNDLDKSLGMNNN